MVVTARKSRAHAQRGKADDDAEYAADDRGRKQRQRNAAGADHGERRGIGAGAVEGAVA